MEATERAVGTSGSHVGLEVARGSPPPYRPDRRLAGRDPGAVRLAAGPAGALKIGDLARPSGPGPSTAPAPPRPKLRASVSRRRTCKVALGSRASREPREPRRGRGGGLQGCVDRGAGSPPRRDRRGRRGAPEPRAKGARGRAGATHPQLGAPIHAAAAAEAAAPGRRRPPPATRRGDTAQGGAPRPPATGHAPSGFVTPPARAKPPSGTLKAGPWGGGPHSHPAPFLKERCRRMPLDGPVKRPQLVFQIPRDPAYSPHS